MQSPLSCVITSLPTPWSTVSWSKHFFFMYYISIFIIVYNIYYFSIIYHKIYHFIFFLVFILSHPLEVYQRVR